MLGHLASLVKKTFTYASIVLVTLIIADTLLFMFLPPNFVRNFYPYRSGGTLAEYGLGGVTNGNYPNNYFVSHPTRGFDIRPGARGTHSVDGFSYPIWSNRLGCFDREWDSQSQDYYYFAGDSNTWGYTPFEEKFATIFEERSGVRSMKCGVPHTGQLHQFGKFVEIVRKITTLPKHVIVGYCDNDISNDYAHPHSTVAGGWLVDDVFLDERDYSLVRVDRPWIEERISAESC